MSRPLSLRKLQLVYCSCCCPLALCHLTPEERDLRAVCWSTRALLQGLMLPPQQHQLLVPSLVLPPLSRGVMRMDLCQPPPLHPQPSAAPRHRRTSYAPPCLCRRRWISPALLQPALRAPLRQWQRRLQPSPPSRRVQRRCLARRLWTSPAGRRTLCTGLSSMHHPPLSLHPLLHTTTPPLLLLLLLPVHHTPVSVVRLALGIDPRAFRATEPHPPRSRLVPRSAGLGCRASETPRPRRALATLLQLLLLLLPLTCLAVA